MRKIPLCIPYTGQEEKDAVIDVIDSGWYAHGPKNHEFEAGFAEYLGYFFPAVSTKAWNASLSRTSAQR